MTDDNAPIEPQDYLYGIKVVELDNIRIARGKTKRPYEKCNHLHMVIDDNERRVFCEDCQMAITAFDGLMALFKNWGKIVDSLNRRSDDVKAAEKYSIIRIATKNIDAEFMKQDTVPCCPHCNEGLIPDDFVKINRASKSLVMQKRKNQELQK